VYLLDSNVLSELRPGKAGQSSVVRAWAASVPLKLFYLSSITILEQEEGILRQERRTPPEGQALRRWAMAVHELFAGRILAFGEREALLCATWRAGSTGHVANAPASFRRWFLGHRPLGRTQSSRQNV